MRAGVDHFSAQVLPRAIERLGELGARLDQGHELLHSVAVTIDQGVDRCRADTGARGERLTPAAGGGQAGGAEQRHILRHGGGETPSARAAASTSRAAITR